MGSRAPLTYDQLNRARSPILVRIWPTPITMGAEAKIHSTSVQVTDP
jgi:hypothetical protein